MSDTQSSASPPQNVLDVVQAGHRRRFWRMPLVWVSATLLLVGGAAVYGLQSASAPATTTQFVTEPLKKGSLTLTVSANGTLAPTRSVTLGSELSGTVREVLVDVNDRVKKGQVLVVLDTAKLNDQVTRSRAGLALAQAQWAQATATVKEAQANLMRQEEVSRLSGGKVPSAAELDAARANVERAKAAEVSAQASVEQARATLSTDETNLSKASIRSPIDGVVLSRTVEPGNAVAASLQAVTLMTIAEDLKRMRLEVSVDEADVGAIRVGQGAEFTVSAHPSRKYPAKITRVAFGSTKTENVVTYTTYLEVDNSDLSLRPGMTAAAQVVATQRSDVLLVPNTALRFNPNSASAAPKSDSVVSKFLPRPPSTGVRKTARPDTKPGERQLWVLKDGQPTPLAVKTGITDGRMTEVSGDGVVEGLAIITDQRSAGAGK